MALAMDPKRSGGELVSCIMATGGRPHFFRQALRYFLLQTYRPAELIVVDDGVEPVGSYCDGLERVRYIRLPGPATTGAKLNIAIEHARGDLLQKLDDDDYYHRDFLQTAVSHMPAENRDGCLAAWDCFLILIAGEGRLRYSGHGWTIGNTLLFTRGFWAQAPFRDVARGADTHFLRDRPGSLIRICAPEQCIVVRHGRNTWKDMRSGETVENYFRRFPFYAKPAAAVLEPQDWGFYESLPAAASSGTTTMP